MTLASDNIDRIFATNNCLLERYNYPPPTCSQEASHLNQGPDGTRTKNPSPPSASASTSRSRTRSRSHRKPKSKFHFSSVSPIPPSRTLFRLLAKDFLDSEIGLGQWKTIYLELVDEFKNFQGRPVLDAQSPDMIPVECQLLFQSDEQCSIIDHHDSSLTPLIDLQVRGIQSTNWNDAETLPHPGVGRNLQGGLQLLVQPKSGDHRQMPTSCWIKLSCSAKVPHMGPIVPVVLGPFNITGMHTIATPVHTEQDYCHEIYRPVEIPAMDLTRTEFRPPTPTSPSTSPIMATKQQQKTQGITATTTTTAKSKTITSKKRTMLLKEVWHHHVPQGRVWDSAFIMKDYFSSIVSKGLVHSNNNNNYTRASPPVFAHKRILDLSAGTGFLGLTVAGLAQLEHDCHASSRIVGVATANGAHMANVMVEGVRGARFRSSVTMTDLNEALQLLRLNIHSNHKMIAPDVEICAKKLEWGQNEIGQLG
ncbi:hypothetical protein BG004_006577, partial [Podila humilis]